MKISKLKLSSTTILILAFFGVLIFFSMQKPESAGMKAMLANPVANMQLTTAREIKRFQRDKDTVLGKPIYAEILVEYEPVGNNTQGDVYDEIVGIIKKSGWEKEDVTSGLEGKYYKAETRYGSFGKHLRIRVATDSQSSSVSLKIVAR